MGYPALGQNFGMLGLFHSERPMSKASVSFFPSSRFQLHQRNTILSGIRSEILPKDFEATRPLTFLDRIYFGGSNDLVGLRPVAIAQQKMPDPMLQSLYTLYVRSSIGLKKYTRLVLHCEYLLLVKTMSSMNFVLPQLGLRQRF